MEFFNKPRVWIAISLVFAIFLAFFSGASLLDVFVIEHDSNEDIIIEAVDFGTQNETMASMQGAESESAAAVASGNVNTNTNNKQTTADSKSDKISVVKQVGAYSNDNVSIVITEKLFTVGSDKTTYFVVDIKVSSAQYLKTALASGDKLTTNKTETVANIASVKNAILAINGDGCGQSKRTTGYVVRDGVTYRSAARGSSGDTEALVIHGDGNMSVIDERKTSLDSVENKWQVFSFGPALIKNGVISVTSKQEISGQSMADNPRTSIGMVEPLHYVIIVGNGRTNASKGLTLYQLAEALVYEGCTVGYNLDGGGSSTLWFNGKVINYPTTNGGKYSEREVSDIVYVEK